MSAKAKLDLNSLTDAEVPDLTTLIVTSMTGNTTFPAPAPVLTVLTAQAKTMRDRIAARDALLQQAQTMTLQIRTDRTVLEASLTAESATVDTVVAKLPADQQAAAITSAGMDVADSTGTPSAPCPKSKASPPPPAMPRAASISRGMPSAAACKNSSSS